MDVDMEIDEVDLSEDQKNIIQNMSSLFPKEVTANFVNVLRSSFHGSKTPKKQSTLDGWLRKSISPKTSETPSSKKQQNLPNSSSRSPEECKRQDSQSENLQNEPVGLGNSNNALQSDSSGSIKESVELDSEKMNMEPPKDEDLVKRMVSKNLIIELKRVEIGNPSVQKQLARLTPEREPSKVTIIQEKILNRNKNASEQIHYDCNGLSNEMSANDSLCGPNKQSSGLCKNIDILNVDSISSPKNKAKRPYIKEPNSLQDDKASCIEVCQNSSDIGGNCDSLDADSFPSPRKKNKIRRHDKNDSSIASRKDVEISDASSAISDKTENKDSASWADNVNNDNLSPVQSSAHSLPSHRKNPRTCDKKESSFVSKGDSIKISDASSAISDKTESKDSASWADNVNNDNSSPVQSSANYLPSLRKKMKRHDKKESSSVKRKGVSESSNASPAISHETEKGDSASLADNVNENNSSSVQTPADSLPSPKKKIKRHHDKREASSVNRMKSSLNHHITENSDTNAAISEDTEKRNTAPLVRHVNNINSSLSQSSVVPPTKFWIRKTRQTSCSLSNDADGTYFVVKENDETDISENIILTSKPVKKTNSRPLRTKLKHGVGSDNKSTDSSSLVGQPETVVITEKGKRSRTLSKESTSSFDRTRQGSSPIESGTKLKNVLDSMSTEGDETSLKESAIKQISKRSRTVSKESVNDSIRTSQGSSPVKNKEKEVLESKSSSKQSKKNKKFNQTVEISGKPNEDFASTESLNHLREVVHHLNGLVEATEESDNESSDTVNENTSSKTNTICENKEIKSQASGKAGRLTARKKITKKLEIEPKQNVIIENGVEDAEIRKINHSAAERATNSKVNETTTTKTKTSENLYKKVYQKKRLNGVHKKRHIINGESEIMTPNQSIISRTKRTSPCKINVGAQLSNATGETSAEDAVLDCDLVKEECISEDGSMAGSNNVPDIEENGNADLSESNNQTVNKLHPIIRTIKSTKKTNQRKAKRIKKSPCGSNLVDKQPQIDDSTPNEVSSDLNQLRTTENKITPKNIKPSATKELANSSITVEDELRGEDSQTSSAEKHKNLEQFYIVKKLCSPLNITTEQLLKNRKMIRELKSPCKSDTIAFISGHKFKSGQIVPSLFKVDSNEQFKKNLQSFADET